VNAQRVGTRFRPFLAASAQRKAESHGSFGGHASGWAKNAKGMFLILHGAEDPNYPVEFGHVIDELKAAKTPFEVELYSGTAHGFSQPKNKAEERAITQAKATAGRTLKELFGV
jgi:dienelactone hydrolase